MNRRELLGVGVTLMAAARLAAGAPTEATPLIRRRIPSSAEELPIIGLGTSGPFEVGAAAAQRAPLQEVLGAFFAAGGRLIDTSPMYSTAEGVLGDLLTPQMHLSAFLATKVWMSGEAAGVEQMTHSAQQLKTQRLDLIQVHNLLDLDTQLKTLRAWKEAGRVRYIGVTHYTVGAHAQLARVLARERLDFVQFNYSPVTRDAEQRLLPLAAGRRPRRGGAGQSPLRGW
jgi:aryl-alcohol dehydrogenase-like predicted oxidoreductase